MKDFKGKVAVVTGAASGIGRALAQRFAAEGMKVVLADVDPEALGRARAELEATGAEALAVRTDVSQAADVDALAQRTVERFGAVHVVCNNAGVGGEPAATWEGALANWEWVLGVNLWGVIHGVRAFVPIMLRQGTEGHVVNTASMAGHMSLPFMAPYHVTKFAVVTLSESLHYELARAGGQVKASVLCPGFVRTNIMDDERTRPAALRAAPPPHNEAAQALRSLYEQMVASGMDPEQVANVVLEAIRAERFYIFPHPELLVAVQQRAETIVAQRNPEVALPPALQPQR